MATKNKKSKKQESTKAPIPFEQELKEIYADKDGMIDMTKLDHKQRSKWWKKLIVGVGILAVLATVSWAGFFLYESKPNFSNDRVAFDVRAPFSAHAGEVIEYTFTVTNNELVTLEELALNVKFPHGFMPQTMEPSGTQASGFFQDTTNVYDFDLPRITAGNSYTARVRGQLIGEIGFLPTVSARLKYSPENYSSNFEKNGTFTTEITDTKLALTAEYRPQATHDEATSIIVRLTNTDEQSPLTGIRLSFDLPETLHDAQLREHRDNTYNLTPQDLDEESESAGDDEEPVAEEEPTPDETETFIDLSSERQELFAEQGILDIEGIAPGASVTFELSGRFMVEENSKETITLITSLADVTETYNLQTEEVLEIQVIKGELLTTLIVNGSEHDTSVDFEGALNYLLVIQNKSKAALGDVKVRLVVDSPLINWKTLDDDNGGTVNGSQILWTSEEIDALRLLLPEDEIEIPVTLNLHPATQLTRSTALEIPGFFEATINQIDGIAVAKTTESPTVIARLNSDTQLTAQARYFLPDGNAVGSGPLPPQVGETTNYQLVWDVSNTLHELESVTIQATLPDGVEWGFQSDVDAGTIAFDNKTVTWTINKMPLSVQNLQARFMVSITPQARDANTLMTLLNESMLTATDTTTNSSMTRTTSSLTTNISNDSGLVQ